MINSYEWLHHKKSRFYSIKIQKNDESGYLLKYQWGSCTSSRGGKKYILAQSLEEAQGYIIKMIKRRKVRGYELIAPDSK